ncbi:ABC transporter ATP-binding protein [Euzebya tangerina]|uniref:ABC transporter ATP-binding protein n=1 Tax=Euzebya tangerina TaxID=591198 RepID=UPI000E319F1A|nr:ABC transporter ATP-binding protein [Euzebya tangerina]
MIATFRAMIEVCGSHASLMRRALVLATLAAVCQGLAYAGLFGFFDALFARDESVWFWIGGIGALILLDAALRFGSGRAEWQVYIDVADEVREDLGAQLQRMPLQTLLARRTGDLNMVLTSGVQDVVSIAGGLYAVVITTIVAPAVTILAMVVVDWRLALALLLVFPLAVPVYGLVRRIGAKENRISSRAHAEVASQLVEYAQGLPVLRATRQVGPRSDRLQASLAHLREAQTHGLQLGTWPSIGMSTIVQVGTVAVTALAVSFVLDATLETSVVVALIAVSVRFSEPLALFANLATMFDFMEAALDRITELMAAEPLPVLQAGAADEISPSNESGMALHDVTFAYEGTDEPVLRDLSITFPARSLTALVGSSGSGKTTVTRMLTRFADPQSGTVTLGGVDIRTLEPTELMRHISVVFQDVYLFDDTIAENIRLARPQATRTEIEAAARAANCHSFIERLPQGYDTTVGEIGGALSGGERQRISIARAILKNAPIVVLDEPTSALDTESEVAVQQAVDTLVRDRTVVVIAHRLSTVAAADQIIVLEDGEVAERGVHADLVAADGRYAEMWRAQQSAREWRITDATATTAGP